MNNYLPLFAPGADITLNPSAPVTGGQLLTITGDRTVAPATAGSTPVGVAAHDAAVGDLLTVHTAGTHALTAAAAVTAGQVVTTADDGQIGTTEGATVGLAIKGAAIGEQAEVILG